MDKVEELIRFYQAAGLYTHAYVACGFLNANTLIYEKTLSPDGRTIFDLSSLTKALFTTPAVLSTCLDQGKDPKISALSDVFGQTTCEDLGKQLCQQTVASFLRHETGLPAWRNFYVECDGQRQTLRDVIVRTNILTSNYSAGSGHPQELYSDVGFIILGELLARRAKKSLAKIWSEFSTSMGMSAAAQLGPSTLISKQHAVPTAYCPVRQRQLIGEVHDENAWALGGFCGHSGLFGSGAAVCAFLQKLWQDTAGRKILEANFAEADSAGDSLLGWRKGRDFSSKSFADGRGCGHLGFTGTAFWVDPSTKTFAVVLTNRVISGRIPGAIKQMRADSFAALWGLLTQAA